MLKSHTIETADGAYLETDRTGCALLYFSGRRYGVNDYVPASLVVGDAALRNVTAGEFVYRRMLRDYGYRTDEWPAVARQFLKHSRLLVVARTTKERHAHQQSQGANSIG